MSVLLGLMAAASNKSHEISESAASMYAIIPVVTTGLHHDSHHPTISTTSHQNKGRESGSLETRRGMFNDHKIGATIILGVIAPAYACHHASRSQENKVGVLYVGSEPEYQLMHNTTRRRPRRMSTDVVQVDPAVHCILQLACGVSALHSTIPSDSCTRIREHMQLVLPHKAAFAVLRSHAHGWW
jgi:hypothetical protein